MLTAEQIKLAAIQAKEELEYEEYRKCVELHKEQIKLRKNWPWWKRLFPYKITFTKLT